jgi:hypothetical protein
MVANVPHETLIKMYPEYIISDKIKPGGSQQIVRANG